MPLLYRFTLLFFVLLGTCAAAPNCFAQTDSLPAFPEDFEDEQDDAPEQDTASESEENDGDARDSEHATS